MYQIYLFKDIIVLNEITSFRVTADQKLVSFGNKQVIKKLFAWYNGFKVCFIFSNAEKNLLPASNLLFQLNGDQYNY